jgi:hypothetical protein
MRDKIIKFIKIYSIFMAVALLINLPMEILIPTPEEKNPLAIIFFYTMFNFVGSIIFLLKKYQAKIMGILSFVLGFLLEFTFMRPDWVQDIYALNISVRILLPVLISAVYWFIPWSVPTFVLHKFLDSELRKKIKS